LAVLIILTLPQTRAAFSTATKTVNVLKLNHTVSGFFVQHSGVTPFRRCLCTVDDEFEGVKASSRGTADIELAQLFHLISNHAVFFVKEGFAPGGVRRTFRATFYNCVVVPMHGERLDTRFGARCGLWVTPILHFLPHAIQILLFYPQPIKGHGLPAMQPLWPNWAHLPLSILVDMRLHGLFRQAHKRSPCMVTRHPGNLFTSRVSIIDRRRD